MSEVETIKLDEIKSDVSEIKGQVRDIWHVLNGHEGALGMSQKLAIIWRMHAWVIAGVSAFGGSVATAMVMKTFGLLK
jgi:hypothetical protein